MPLKSHETLYIARNGDKKITIPLNSYSEKEFEIEAETQKQTSSISSGIFLATLFIIATLIWI